MFKIINQLFKIEKKKNFHFIFNDVYCWIFLDMLSIGFLIPLLNSLFENKIEIPFITNILDNFSSDFAKEEIISIAIMLIFLTF